MYETLLETYTLDFCFFQQRNEHLLHCVKSVQIRRFSGPYFAVLSPITGKYEPEKTPYLDTFHVVIIKSDIFQFTIHTVNTVYHWNGNISFLEPKILSM